MGRERKGLIALVLPRESPSQANLAGQSSQISPARPRGDALHSWIPSFDSELSAVPLRDAIAL